MGILNTILNIVFPVNCIGCTEKDTLLCDKCLFSCPPAERESAKWIFPMYDYRHPLIKRAIWLLKYKCRKDLANVFASAMYARIQEELGDQFQFNNFTNPILIPIPLAKGRLRERGFNQATLMCKKLISLDEEKTFSLKENILVKPSDTIHQAKIEDRRKRMKNIIGTFSVKNSNLIKKRNIILIDDVTTTGATLTEAKKMLREAGARKIIAFTIAH